MSRQNERAHESGAVMGLYVTNDLGGKTLFVQPTNKLSASQPFLTHPDDDMENLIDSPRSDTPVDVRVNAATLSITTQATSIDSGLSSAQRVSEKVDTAIESATSMTERLKELASYAKDSSYTDEDRAEWNKEAQTIKDRLSKYYDNAYSGTTKIAQGGSSGVGASYDGQEISYSYADLNMESLGIATLDLSTASDASDAYDALEGALAKLGSQERTTAGDIAIVEGRSGAVSGTAEAAKTPALAEANNEYEQTAYENSLAVLQGNMDYALNVQGDNITNKSLNTMVEGLSSLASRIASSSKAQEQEAKDQAQEASKKKAEEAKDQEQSQASASKSEEPQPQESQSGSKQDTAEASSEAASNASTETVAADTTEKTGSEESSL